MIFLRIIAMFLIPLDSPPTSLLLADPIVQYFGTGKQLTKDLFFSGHTATMFVLLLTAISKNEKILFLIGTITVATFVILQHTHYSIDVFAAPFFAYGAYRIIRIIKQNY